MPATGIRNIIKEGGSCLKVIYTFSNTQEFKGTPREIQIDKLANIRFEWDLKLAADTVDDFQYIFKYSLKKFDMTNCDTVKVNIASETLKYSETGIHAPENWSDWKPMGSIKPYLSSELPKTYYATVTILITVYEFKIDTMSNTLYTDTNFTDFYLCTPEGKVAVHKTFMVAHSDVFKAMLSNEWKEKTEGQITIKGVTTQTLQHLKDYMYLGTVPDEGLRPLLLIARFLLMEDLQNHCIRMLAEKVTAEEVFSLIDFACENQIPELPFAMMQLTKDSVVSGAHQMKREWKKLDETQNDQAKTE